VGAIAAVLAVAVALAAHAAGADLAAHAAQADLAERTAGVELVLPDMATSSATIVQADVMAKAAKGAGKRRAPGLAGCFPVPRTTAESMPRTQTLLAKQRPIVACRAIVVRRAIVARPGSRVLTIAAHGRPWGIAPPTVRGRKVRLALQVGRVRGQVREARAGATGPLAHGRQMLAQGQAHARQAMADAASVRGDRMVAVVGQLAAMVVAGMTGTGQVPGVAVGTSPRCRKLRAFRPRPSRPSHRPCRPRRQ